MRHVNKLLLALSSALLLAAFLTTALARNPAPEHPTVVPPHATAYGLSYAEWSAKQWQWLYSLPVDAHPLFDTAPVSAGQSGDVWFLGGTYTTTEVAPGVIEAVVERSCEIDEDTALFFPLVDAEAATIEGNGESEAELRATANFLADLIVPDSLFCEIDGKPVKNLKNFRVESPLFVFGPLPDNNVLQYNGIDAPAGSTSNSVSDGYFVLLNPLSPGEHTIHFGGVLDASDEFGLIFVQDITYHITVPD